MVAAVTAAWNRVRLARNSAQARAAGAQTMPPSKAAPSGPGRPLGSPTSIVTESTSEQANKPSRRSRPRRLGGPMRVAHKDMGVLAEVGDAASWLASSLVVVA